MSDVFEHIDRIIADCSRPVFVEIGAAGGEDTSRICDRIESLKPGVPFEYYAFEPDPRNIAKFKSAKINPAVQLVQSAVGHVNHRATFHQSSGIDADGGIVEHTQSGSLKAPVDHLKEHPWCKFDTDIRVPVITLDSFASMFSLDHIDLIWCDVQGAEDLVLSGGALTFPMTRFFYTEYYDNEMYSGQIPAAEILKRLGPAWKMVEQWPCDVLFENIKWLA